MFDPLSYTFAALADPTRRAILARLALGETSVTELARPFEMSMPAVSKHLKVLEHAGLIVRTREAQWRPCRLDAGPLKEASRWIEDYRKFWAVHVDALERHLDRMDQFTPSKSNTIRRGTSRKRKGDRKMRIKLVSVYVDDQERALSFYTSVFGFVKKADFSQGPFRWLTVASADDPQGTELQLALNNNPAAAAYQQAMFQQGLPAAMFFTDNLEADYERMRSRGAQFTMPPTDVTASKIAMVNDGCGNLIQLTQLKQW